MQKLKKAIAKAIKDADSSWFNENYSKQADAVLQAIRAKGFVIVEAEATEAQVEAGREALTTGRYKPSEVVSKLYAVMVGAADK
ncbi:hypothetical protein [Aestuariispira insulae]|uniref:Uncharacterized protein n=1 Tax=Aestuariispira insulae TaxID=1461337 RepID=A0A3D9H9G8_9PROT|nr:hypothetical protein [Aestuariispira insulae]RED46142.1 hypothetical protein DFP90_11051 [Aestuariispira insulae]